MTDRLTILTMRLAALQRLVALLIEAMLEGGAALSVAELRELYDDQTTYTASRR